MPPSKRSVTSGSLRSQCNLPTIGIIREEKVWTGRTLADHKVDANSNRKKFMLHMNSTPLKAICAELWAIFKIVVVVFCCTKGSNLTFETPMSKVWPHTFMILTCPCNSTCSLSFEPTPCRENSDIEFGCLDELHMWVNISIMCQCAILFAGPDGSETWVSRWCWRTMQNFFFDKCLFAIGSGHIEKTQLREDSCLEIKGQRTIRFRSIRVLRILVSFRSGSPIWRHWRTGFL